MTAVKRPIAILYEHPSLFKPLFRELENRKIPFVRLHASSHQYNPGERDVPYSLVVNRVSASADSRGNLQGIFHSANYLSHVERLGIPVINGTHAQQIESSKARQIEVFASLGLKFPKTRIINHISQIVPAATSLRFPILVKSNLAGRAQNIYRFNSMVSLQRAISYDKISLGIDQTALVQEFISAKDSQIVRVETLNGKFLYAVSIQTETDTYKLRASELTSEHTPRWTGTPENKIKVVAYTPPPQIISEVERIVKTARLDSGAVEYVISEQDGERYYCNLIGLSSYVDDAEEVIGFNPHVSFVNYIEQRLYPAYEAEPRLAL